MSADAEGSMESKESQLGPHVRMAPLKLQALPYHPAFDRPENKSAQTSEGSARPAIPDFLGPILSEAYRFATQEVLKFKSEGTKSSQPSKAPVSVYFEKVPVAKLRSIGRDNALLSPAEYQAWPKEPEYWCARQSSHADSAEAGTASWTEFYSTLKERHSENEGEYTPDVYDARLVLDYGEQVKDVSVQTEQGSFGEVDMRIFEMAHKIPVIYNRVFQVLVITARRGGGEEFLVVQIPVDLTTLDEAYYANGKHHSDTDKTRKKDVVLGMYTSIEHCRRDTTDPQKPVVKWTMATASHAQGNIPLPLQKSGVESAVVKDVGLVIKWCNEKRK